MVVARNQLQLERLSVMGLPVHRCSDYLVWLESQADSGKGGHVVTLNAEMCIQATKIPQLNSL